MRATIEEVSEVDTQALRRPTGAGWDPGEVAEASEGRYRVTRDPLVVDHAERLAGLGSWEWVPATGELVWSDNMFRLYGLEIGAIVPSPEYRGRACPPR